MSPFVRRYAKYLAEKSVSYRTVAFDFCKVKRGWVAIESRDEDYSDAFIFSVVIILLILKPTLNVFFLHTYFSHQTNIFCTTILREISSCHLIPGDCRSFFRKDGGTLRQMSTEKLLKTLPTLHDQLDSLLEFEASPADLNNGVINAAFMLLFRDLIRLFACYNDGIINLLGRNSDIATIIIPLRVFYQLL